MVEKKVTTIPPVTASEAGRVQFWNLYDCFVIIENCSFWLLSRMGPRSGDEILWKKVPEKVKVL